jgi:hypothetical protein
MWIEKATLLQKCMQFGVVQYTQPDFTFTRVYANRGSLG